MWHGNKAEKSNKSRVWSKFPVKVPLFLGIPRYSFNTPHDKPAGNVFVENQLDPFIHFDRTPACDRLTDWHQAITYTVWALYKSPHHHHQFIIITRVIIAVILLFDSGVLRRCWMKVTVSMRMSRCIRSTIRAQLYVTSSTRIPSVMKKLVRICSSSF